MAGLVASVASRAEAALKGGDLAAVLVELDGLPEASVPSLAAWRAEVETRANALAAGATFYFLHGITRDDLPTWWTSVCAGVALLMVNLQFTALPQVITLLGVTWMLRGLHAWSQTGKQSTLWCLAGSLAVWSNLDPRAFIGWLVLVAYLAGTALARKSGRGSHHSDASIKDLAIAIGVGLGPVRRHRTVVIDVVRPVPVVVGVTGIASTIPVEVGLIGVDRGSAVVGPVQHAIAIVVEFTAFRINRLACRCSRALIHVVTYAVAVTVIRAAICINSYATGCAGALVFRVLDAIAIAVQLATPGINFCTCRRVRAIVRAVGNAIAVRVDPFGCARAEWELQAQTEQVVAHVGHHGTVIAVPIFATQCEIR